MDLVFEDRNSKRKIIRKEDEIFTLATAGLYVIKITARVQSKKQLQGTRDQDLRIEINGEKFQNNPAVFSGAKLKGLKEIIFFILPLNNGQQVMSLISEQGAELESFQVFKTPDNANLIIDINNTAEDGDRRPWLAFVLINLSLASFIPTITYFHRKRDSDDVKVIIDGHTQENILRSIKHFLWRFAGSLLQRDGSKMESIAFTPNLPQSVHYIEFLADRMPTLQKISFLGLTTNRLTANTETIEEKIRNKANEFGLDPELMINIARRESQFNPKATSPVGAKGIFQLMDITLKQIANLGFEIRDPYDADQNITGGIIYFKWLKDMYNGDPQQIEKTLAAWNWGQGNFPKEGPLDFGRMPDETKNFINKVLGK